MPEISKPKKYDKFAAAYKDAPARLNEIADVCPKLEIRSVTFLREDPATGGKWFISVRGHIKTHLGPEPKHF